MQSIIQIAPGFNRPLCVPYCSSFSSLSPFLSFPLPSLCLPLLFSLSPPLFPLLLLFDSISFILYSSLPRRRSRTQQLRRPWDKRLHFLIFKCAQTSYPAIVCPTEALPRRGFRADKPFQPSMHAGLQRCCILPLCSLSLSLSFLQKRFHVFLPSFSSRGLSNSAALDLVAAVRGGKCKSPTREQRLWNRKGTLLSRSALGRRILCYNRVGPQWPSFFPPPPKCTDRRGNLRGEYYKTRYREMMIER